jgi:hypothetical protein
MMALLSTTADGLAKACAEIADLKARLEVLEAAKAKKDAFMSGPYWQKG